MTKSSNNPSAEQDGEPAYEVGYGRPPKHTRIKPGEIRNPRGRTKGQKNVATSVQEALNERVTVREGSRTRTVTKFDAVILRLMSEAASGNAKAQANLFALLRQVGLAEPPAAAPVKEAPLTADDAGIIDGYVRRHREQLGIANPDDHASPTSGPDNTLGKGKPS